eukprot:357549-Chlamydomonas_euryale.AAC.1
MPKAPIGASRPLGRDSPHSHIPPPPPRSTSISRHTKQHVNPPLLLVQLSFQAHKAARHPCPSRRARVHVCTDARHQLVFLPRARQPVVLQIDLQLLDRQPREPLAAGPRACPLVPVDCVVRVSQRSGWRLVGGGAALGAARAVRRGALAVACVAQRVHQVRVRLEVRDVRLRVVPVGVARAWRR